MLTDPQLDSHATAMCNIVSQVPGYVLRRAARWPALVPQKGDMVAIINDDDGDETKHSQS